MSLSLLPAPAFTELVASTQAKFGGAGSLGSIIVTEEDTINIRTSCMRVREYPLQRTSLCGHAVTAHDVVRRVHLDWDVSSSIWATSYRKESKEQTHNISRHEHTRNVSNPPARALKSSSLRAEYTPGRRVPRPQTAHAGLLPVA